MYLRISLLASLLHFVMSKYQFGPNTRDLRTLFSISPPDPSAKVRPPLPRGSSLQVPPKMKLRALALASGTANYTCDASEDSSSLMASWTFVGIQAELYNLGQNLTLLPLLTGPTPPGRNHGLHFHPEDLDLIGYAIYDAWTDPSGEEFNIASFDFSRKLVKISNDSFVMAKKEDDFSSVADPVNPKVNLPWVILNAVDGKFAKSVLRTNTHGGVPATGHCKRVSEELTIPFLAVYWFYK
ncbi:hypothetical protein O181_030126 [Austropuccinia psidii MF-1]|uniref:Uncharacterized protein n=1 Tax=Austropuccinia psidii MF-1 TaxID=1389203 RepID=A0A9Q3CSD0_9BASI|nr:hypothetical protein [Austropuccinia psidii MF-1]